MFETVRETNYILVQGFGLIQIDITGIIEGICRWKFGMEFLYKKLLLVLVNV
jgi:hypothetical protein